MTMQICYELVPPMDPDLLCEGALDNYGPHVCLGFHLIAFDCLVLLFAGFIHHERDTQNTTGNLPPGE
jgi:hypothetical protein